MVVSLVVLSSVVVWPDVVVGFSFIGGVGAFVDGVIVLVGIVGLEVAAGVSVVVAASEVVLSIVVD